MASLTSFDIVALRDDVNAGLEWLDTGFVSTDSWQRTKANPPGAILKRGSLQRERASVRFGSEDSAGGDMLQVQQQPSIGSQLSVSSAGTAGSQRRRRARGSARKSKFGSNMGRLPEEQQQEDEEEDVETLPVRRCRALRRAKRPSTSSRFSATTLASFASVGGEPPTHPLALECVVSTLCRQDSYPFLGDECLEDRGVSRCERDQPLEHILSYLEDRDVCFASCAVSEISLWSNKLRSTSAQRLAGADNVAAMDLLDDIQSVDSNRSTRCCRHCQTRYAGFGDICSDCRKMGPRGSIHQCATCCNFFSGFGAICQDCKA